MLHHIAALWLLNQRFSMTSYLRIFVVSMLKITFLYKIWYWIYNKSGKTKDSALKFNRYWQNDTIKKFEICWDIPNTVSETVMKFSRWSLRRKIVLTSALRNQSHYNLKIWIILCYLGSMIVLNWFTW